jgi:predicted dehydrogenase
VEVETLAQGVVRTASGTLIGVTSSMVADRERDPTSEVYGDCGAAFYRGGSRPRVRFSGVRVQRERPPGWGVHALQRSLLGFARWVQEDVPYLTPLSEALPVMAALDALYASAASGSRSVVLTF